HSTISAADQDPRPVGGGQDLPVACGNSRGPADVVVARELDHHGFLVTQFGGCQASVVPVEAPPGREREPETNGERGEYAPDRPEIGVTLADIVEQGRPNQVGAVVRRSLDAAGRLVSVTLVGAGLAEERSEGAGASGEPLLDLGDLVRTQRGSGNEVEEPRREVRPRPRHRAQPRRDLQSTHSVDSGRASRRAAGISLPHSAQMPYVPCSILSRAFSTSRSWPTSASIRPRRSVRSAVTAPASA